MHHLEKAAVETLGMLRQLMSSINNEVYIEKPAVLNGSGIGQHCRHMLEMFICLNEGYVNGVVNYENRKRNPVIEQDKDAAINCLDTLLPQLRKPEKHLILKTGYDTLNNETEECMTTYSRELTYVLEHAVHHMALIAAGIKSTHPGITLPENFGVALSTINYRKALVR